MTGESVNPAEGVPLGQCLGDPQVGHECDPVQQELTRLRAEVARLEEDNRLLLEKLNATLDGTGICVWQGMVRTGELRVFNLQNFREGDMAPHFDVWRAKLHPEDREHALGSYFGHLSGQLPFYEAEYRTINPKGEITWLWDRGRVLEWDSHGEPVRIMGAHIDVTQRKEYERRLSLQANTDALTGLLNRQAFRYAFEQRSQRTSGALMFIDLDDFKVVNDQLGHVCGDRVLQRMADWLRSMLPESALCGRYGGDEFVVHVPGATHHTFGELADALLARAVEYVPDPNSLLRVGMSIGIALWHEPGISFEQALEAADRAMYQAKERGKLAWHQLNVSFE